MITLQFQRLVEQVFLLGTRHFPDFPQEQDTFRGLADQVGFHLVEG